MSGYFADKRILILCSGNNMRSLLRNTLVRLGADNSRIFSSKSFKEAADMTSRQEFEVMIVDYVIDEHFGLELSQVQKDQFPEDTKRIFIVVADSGAASAVADSAEEEVDAFLIKPLSEQVLLKYFERIIQSKINPSPQTKLLAKAKEMLLNRDFVQLERFMMMNLVSLERPATAYSYLGQSKELQGKFTEALSNYDIGLSFTHNHFKCLYGKFQMHYKLGQRQEAYRTVQMIKKIYPFTPEILKTAFCVVVETYNFAEVEEFYQLYLKQIRKPDDLKFIVSTALLTAGKALLRKQEAPVDVALNYFCKGSVISGRQTEYIENVINELIRLGHVDRVNKYFEMFKDGEVPARIIRPLRFRQYMREKRDLNFLITEGKRMIFESAVDESTLITILDIAAANSQDMLLQSLATKAIELFPENRQVYAAYLS